MFSKGRTAMLFSGGIDVLASSLNKDAARPEKKNQAVANAATHKNELTSHRIGCFFGVTFGNLAATGSAGDVTSRAVKCNPEAIASLTLLSALCHSPGLCKRSPRSFATTTASSAPTG